MLTSAKKYQNKMTVYNKLSPSGFRPGVMYGLTKVHKKCINGSPHFRSILSAIGTSTYNLIQFLVTLLSPLASNDFTFPEDIRSQDQNLYMATIDVDSLFINFPLDETNDIFVSLIFKDSDVVNCLTTEDVHKLLNIATKESVLCLIMVITNGFLLILPALCLRHINMH